MNAAWLADDCVYVDKRDRVSRIRGYLNGDSDEVPIIEDHNRPYAIVDPRAAMRRGALQNETIEKLAWPVPVIKDGDNDAQILAHFVETGADKLPAVLGRPPRKAGYLDAAAFLQHAFDEGPSAAEAARGVPPVPVDGTIEDALQAFRVSNLPILPVLDNERIVGVIRRAAVLAYIDPDSGGMRRRDFVGERTNLRNDSFQALIEQEPPTIRPDAGFREVKAALAKAPCLFVAHGVVEEVTAVSVLYAIAAAQKQPPSRMPSHFRQTKTGG